MNEYYAGARGRDGLATVFRFASCERAPNRRPTTFPPSHPSIRLPLFALHLTHRPHSLPLRLLSIRAGVARGDSPLVLRPSSRAASLTSHPRASLLGLAVQPLILRWELLPLLNWASQTGLGSAATFLLWLNPIPRDPWLAVRLFVLSPPPPPRFIHGSIFRHGFETALHLPSGFERGFERLFFFWLAYTLRLPTGALSLRPHHTHGTTRGITGDLFT
jgi:hypothetical protein